MRNNALALEATATTTMSDARQKKNEFNRIRVERDAPKNVFEKEIFFVFSFVLLLT
jgi:hypothetical protein